jgi:hypothetical protein
MAAGSGSRVKLEGDARFISHCQNPLKQHLPQSDRSTTPVFHNDRGKTRRGEMLYYDSDGDRQRDNLFAHASTTAASTE